MRFTAWCILAVAALWAGFAVAADKSETIEELLLRRIKWITEHYQDLEYNGEELPKVETLPKSTLLNLAGRGENANVFAIYDHTVNAIWMRDDLDAGSLDHSFVLIHELVHFLQQVKNPAKEGECFGRREPQAYEVQERWQREFGPWPLEWNWLFVIGISDCRYRGNF